jgi:GT2 family glycosyltransferase
LPESSTSRRVYAVVAVHDRVGFTRDCLRALSAQSYARLNIVVVDDGSVDDTAAVVQKEYPEVTLLRGDGDLWWTGATNLGVAWVLERADDQDYVLTLNNDTVVEPDYVETLVRAARDFAPALVGSVAVDARDGDTIADGGPVVTWGLAKWGMLGPRRSLRACIEQGFVMAAPDCLSGRGTLIPVECLRRVGLFDARRLPQYGADYEFSRRAARAGYRLLVSYASPVFSHVDATGTSARRGRISWRRFAGMYFSRRSSACLLYRWRFALLAAPRWAVVPYLVLDTIRVVVGGLRDQVTLEPVDEF